MLIAHLKFVNKNLFLVFLKFQRKEAFLLNSSFEKYSKESITSHFAVSFVRSWDSNIKYFVSSQLLRKFESINKNRLKNIFYFVLGNDLVWLLVIVLNIIKMFQYLKFF